MYSGREGKGIPWQCRMSTAAWIEVVRARKGNRILDWREGGPLRKGKRARGKCVRDAGSADGIGRVREGGL